jgi:hypothetical protein
MDKINSCTGLSFAAGSALDLSKSQGFKAEGKVCKHGHHLGYKALRSKG